MLESTRMELRTGANVARSLRIFSILGFPGAAYSVGLFYGLRACESFYIPHVFAPGAPSSKLGRAAAKKPLAFGSDCGTIGYSRDEGTSRAIETAACAAVSWARRLAYRRAGPGSPAPLS